jgi:hypothetical protein
MFEGNNNICMKMKLYLNKDFFYYIIFENKCVNKKLC